VVTITTAAVSGGEVGEVREERSTVGRTITDNREDMGEVDSKTTARRTIMARDVERDATIDVRRENMAASRAIKVVMAEGRIIMDNRGDMVEEDSKTMARRRLTVADVEKVITDARRENMVAASRAIRGAMGVDSKEAMEVDSRDMEVEAISLREESKFHNRLMAMD
jgi:hypothetical protein